MNSIDPGLGGGMEERPTPSADRRPRVSGRSTPRASAKPSSTSRGKPASGPRSPERRAGHSGATRSNSGRGGAGRSGRRIGVATWALAAVVFVAIGVGVWALTGQTPTLTVEMTDTPDTVAQRLFEIDDKYTPADVVAILEGPGPTPIAGTYTIDTDLDLMATVRALQTDWIEADPGLTFPEGFTVQKIANRIAANRWAFTANQLMTAADGLTVDPRVQRPGDVTSVEGLLYPNTYAVDASGNASATMGQMLVAMQSLLFDELDTEAGSQALGLSPYQVVTIASLIEKEAKTEQDRPLIARVILNRLETETALQIDASLYYQAPEEATWAELRDRDTPYNLYEHEGLPPTPIANPSRASLEAALNPAPPLDPSDPRCEGVADTDCKLMFYVIKDADGNHEFAVTYDQHQANIEAARAAGVL